MSITVRYEHVPHFCFTCGRICHAAMNCEEEGEVLGIKFGEELRALSPRQGREVIVRPVDARTARNLFPMGIPCVRSSDQVQGGKGKRSSQGGGDGDKPNADSGPMHEKAAENQKAPDVGAKEDVVMQDEAGQGASNNSDHTYSRKDRVSFGMNMSTDDELSGGESSVKAEGEPATAAERLLVRKYQARTGSKSEKKTTLKVNNLSKTKKQKTLIKVDVQMAFNSVEQVGSELLVIKPKTEPDDQRKLLEDEAGGSTGKRLPSNLMGTHDEGRQEQ
jgi:hypothetical protein